MMGCARTTQGAWHSRKIQIHCGSAPTTALQKLTRRKGRYLKLSQKKTGWLITKFGFLDQSQQKTTVPFTSEQRKASRLFSRLGITLIVFLLFCGSKVS